MAEWSWKKESLRFDPHRGYLLCEPCWNHQHWEPAYYDAGDVQTAAINARQAEKHEKIKPYLHHQEATR